MGLNVIMGITGVAGTLGIRGFRLFLAFFKFWFILVLRALPMVLAWQVLPEFVVHYSY